MPNKFLMTNEQILRTAGVSQDMINAVKTADSSTAVNTLDPIFNTLMSFVMSQRVEIANLNNPLRILEQSYANHNGGSLNGLFQEILIPTRDKGENNLYGGRNRVVKEVKNPYTEQDYGKEPLQFTYGINAKMERDISYDRGDFLMALKEGSLIDFMKSRIATMESENNGSRYIIENNVLNCERFQYADYDNAQSFSDAFSLGAFIHKVFKMQDFPEKNMDYKRIKFNSTRKNSNFVLILDSEFWYEYSQKYQFSSFLKPFIFKSQDKDTYGTEMKVDRIIEVDELKATTLAENSILNPMNMTSKQLENGKKLIGRIVDMNAIKFGVGLKTSISKPLDSRVSYYTEASDYCFNMCGAYTNVPLIINKDFDYNRKIFVMNEQAQE